MPRDAGRHEGNRPEGGDRPRHSMSTRPMRGVLRPASKTPGCTGRRLFPKRLAIGLNSADAGEAPKKPKHHENDNNQAKDAAEPRPAIAVVSVIAATTPE